MKIPAVLKVALLPVLALTTAAPLCAQAPEEKPTAAAQNSLVWREVEIFAVRDLELRAKTGVFTFKAGDLTFRYAYPAPEMILQEAPVESSASLALLGEMRKASKLKLLVPSTPEAGKPIKVSEMILVFDTLR